MGNYPYGLKRLPGILILLGICMCGDVVALFEVDYFVNILNASEQFFGKFMWRSRKVDKSDYG